jgi:hypothetical protein
MRKLMDEPFGVLDAQTRLVMQEGQQRIEAGDNVILIKCRHSVGVVPAASPSACTGGASVMPSERRTNIPGQDRWYRFCLMREHISPSVPTQD